MTEYKVYYLLGPDGIEAGPFPTVDAAVKGKNFFTPPFAPLLKVVSSVIQVEQV
jgi:hypothetical protein